MPKAGTKQKQIDLSHIVEPLRALAVEVSKLSFDEQNARLHNERNIKTIETSLSQYGQRAPIIVQRDGMIVRSGNGRLLAALNLGWTHIAAVVTDDTDATAKAFALMDNKSAELAEWDFERVSQLLSEIKSSDMSFDMTGFEDFEFESIVSGEWSSSSGVEPRLDSDGEPIVPKLRTFSLFSKEDIIKEAFAYYRRVGFPYPRVERHEAMQKLNALYDTPTEALIKTAACSSLADSYHSHRFTAAAQRMKSPVESFENDRSLKKVMTKEIEASNIGTGLLGFMNLVSGTQACANFRPAFALYIYRKYGVPGGVLLDTSTGYGGRLIGFLCSEMKAYIGIDPNVETYEANWRIVRDLAMPLSKCVQLINQPAEDVKSINFESCDLAFTSPPYFSKEIYSQADTQSWQRYKTFHAWVEGFLKPMLELQAHCLKQGCYSVINISDVKLGKITYPLEEMTVNAALAAGFEHVDTLQYPLPSGPQNMGKERSEPVFVFRKPKADE